MKESRQHNWSISAAEEYYGLKRWGGQNFSINELGELCVHPAGDNRMISVPDILKEAASMGLQPPMTIRVQDLLHRRVVQLNEAFGQAIEQEEYAGSYRGVFPIKVNQLREVVEEILDAGKEYSFGLEAGSKPELMIALALQEKKDSLLICNGYKDDDYIRLALLGRRLGKEVYIVVEQISDIDRILRLTKELQVEPLIGFRVKLQASGEGRWASSSGDNAKFGLTAGEIISAARRLKRAGLGDALRLAHFHIGSQVPNIITIKKAVVEAARFYCELVRLGFPMRYLDVGGGLGIDYDGSRTNFESSMNYSMEEYARDIIFNVKSVCDRAGVPVPDIISESGRALVAPHSILVIEAVDRITKGDQPMTQSKKASKQPIVQDMESILREENIYSQLERFHDAQQKKEEAYNLFTLGYLDLETRARVEGLFWEICRQVRDAVSREGYTPDELAELDTTLAEQYVCNFSVFQSLLDHWALGQLFPIMPLHRLEEEPVVEATLVDITCDSDGKISEFIDLEDVKKTLALHPLQPGVPYYLGVFMVGAYQDIMGDLHNLFGRVNEVHVFLEDDEEDGFYIEETISGLKVDEVLSFIQYKSSDLLRLMKKQVDRATKADWVKPREGVRLLTLYENLLQSKTYLIPGESRGRRRKKKSE